MSFSLPIVLLHCLTLPLSPTSPSIAEILRKHLGSRKVRMIVIAINNRGAATIASFQLFGIRELIVIHQSANLWLGQALRRPNSLHAEKNPGQLRQIFRQHLDDTASPSWPYTPHLESESASKWEALVISTR